MSLAALFEITGTLDFEENGVATLCHADVSEAKVVLTVEVLLGNGNTARKWQIECTDPLRFQIVNDSRGRIYYLTDDPLVWEHTDEGATVGLLGKPADPSRAVSALRAAHVKAVGHSQAEPIIPFERYVRFPSVEDFLAGGHGFLGSGPKRLMMAYADALKTQGVEVYNFDGGGGYYYPQITGITLVKDAPDEPPVAAVTIGERTFVVGRHFQARELK